jgi:hypothetical protein
MTERIVRTRADEERLNALIRNTPEGYEGDYAKDVISGFDRKAYQNELRVAREAIEKAHQKFIDEADDDLGRARDLLDDAHHNFIDGVGAEAARKSKALVHALIDAGNEAAALKSEFDQALIDAGNEAAPLKSKAFDQALSERLKQVALQWAADNPA